MTVIRDKEGHYIWKRGQFSKKIIILNLYMCYSRVSNYVRQKRTELQGKIGESASITGHFNTPLLEMNRSRRQKIRT